VDPATCDSAAAQLARCSGLRELWLSVALNSQAAWCSVADLAPLSACSQLTALKLSGALTGELGDLLCALPSLCSVDFAATDGLSLKLGRAAYRLTALQKLEIVGVSVGAIHPQALAALAGLTCVKVKNISGRISAFYSLLAQLPALHTVETFHRRTAAPWTALLDSTSLQQLELRLRNDARELPDLRPGQLPGEAHAAQCTVWPAVGSPAGQPPQHPG
jgi:hypothetical protein